jgi:hypothetical protein
MMLGRRRALSLGLAGSLSLTRSFAHAGAAPAVDKTALARFIKMRGALDDRMVIGCVDGQYNGVVDGKTMPLFGVVSAVFSRYRPQEGGYGIIEYEQAYYTDLATGKVLDRWKNPYTNETITVPTYDGPTDRQLVTENLQFRSAAPPPPNVHVRHFVQGPTMSGDDIVFVERVSVSVDAVAGKPGFRYADHTSLRAKLSDVARPDTQMAGSATHFEATCAWRPWLKMGGRPGHMTASGRGHFGVTFADLPGGWLEATSSLKPELLKHPESNLE